MDIPNLPYTQTLDEFGCGVFAGRFYPKVLGEHGKKKESEGTELCRVTVTKKGESVESYVKTLSLSLGGEFTVFCRLRRRMNPRKTEGCTE